MFNVNSPILFIIVAIIILAVLSQSVFFLIRALKRAKQIGISFDKLKSTIISSAIFTIAPAVSVLVGVISLSVSLGIPLPWLRLSVVGSLSYETVAAGAAQTALGLTTGTAVQTAKQYVTIATVMTVGIALGLFLAPLFSKKIQSGLIKLENKDKKWSEILNNAMFLGMISAFLGYVFCDVSNLFASQEKLNSLGVSRTAGLIPVCVMAVSAVVMAILGLLSKKLKIRWLTDYALPFSLILGMASAIPFTIWLG